MFLGHFAVAFAAKRVAPKANLGTAILAATLLDVLWSLFLIAGLEIVKIVPGNTPVTPFRFVSYPFSHSLTMAVLWAAVFMAIYAWRTGARRPAVWLGLLVVSHWFLDFLVHQPDLQLFPEIDVYVGLALWESLTATLIIEALIFVAGLWLYVSSTDAVNRTGAWALWLLVALLVVIYAGSIVSPPPHNVSTIVAANLIGTAITVAWGYWIDRHRKATVA